MALCTKIGFLKKYIQFGENILTCTCSGWKCLL